MKLNVLEIAGLLLLVLVLSVISGCGCQQYPASTSSSPVIETRSSETVKVIWADSHQVDDKFVIHGTFRRQFQGGVPMKAHIDVQILSESGDVIREIRTAEMYLPPYQVGKGIRFERFEVQLEDISPDSVTVIVSAHQGKHDA